MFEITIGSGNWAKPGRLLIFHVDPLFAMYFVPYVACVTFATIRIVSALFLKETMDMMANDADHCYRESLKRQDREVKKIRKIFDSGDVDGNASLSKLEFGELFKDPIIGGWLETVGLSSSEANGLFRLMDDGDGMITFEEFLSGCLRFRGGAKKVDLATLLYENRKLISRIDRLEESLSVTLQAEAEALESDLVSKADALRADLCSKASGIATEQRVLQQTTRAEI